MKDKQTKRISIGRIISLVLVVIFIVLLARKTYIGLSVPKSYMIRTANHFDYQRNLECSGYSTAYVLRSLGDDANGLEIYKALEKNNDGTVDPDVLMSYLRNQGYDANRILGDLKDLKKALMKGVPVIAMVRITPGSPYYHYLPVVGYDEEYYYTADSLKYLITGEEEYYNRKISVDDMEKMLSTEFCDEYIYFTISKENQ